MTIRRRQLPMVLILALYALMVVIPIWIVLVSSFKTNSEIYSDPLALPLRFRYDTYLTALFRVRMLASILRTILVGAVATVWSLFLGFLASYGFAKIQNLLTLPLKTLFVAGYLVPTISLLVPIYSMMARAGLINSPMSLIMVYAARNIPTAIIVLTPFIGKIHRSMEESASIDGASLPQVLYHLILPLTRSGIVTASVLSFIPCWNEYFFPLVLTTNIDSAVVQTSLQFLRGERNVDYGVVSAGVVILLAGVALIYTLAQRQLVAGLSGAAVKS